MHVPDTQRSICIKNQFYKFNSPELGNPIQYNQILMPESCLKTKNVNLKTFCIRLNLVNFAVKDTKKNF